MEKLYKCMRDEQPEIILDDETIEKAAEPINRMLDISRKLNLIK
jgi:quinolinate synthase